MNSGIGPHDIIIVVVFSVIDTRCFAVDFGGACGFFSPAHFPPSIPGHTFVVRANNEESGSSVILNEMV